MSEGEDRVGDAAKKAVIEFFDDSSTLRTLTAAGLAITALDIYNGATPPDGWVPWVEMDCFVHPSVRFKRSASGAD